MVASDTGYLAHFLVEFEKEWICMSWKLNERQKISIKIFTTFLSMNSQSMNSLIYVYCIQIPSWSESWSHFFVLPPPKNIFCITPWWVFIFGLGTSTNKRRVSTRSGKSGNLLENQEKSGKFDLFWKKSGKSQGRKFLSMQIFNF